VYLLFGSRDEGRKQVNSTFGKHTNASGLSLAKEQQVSPPRTRVLGVGNLLLGDDGVGIHAVEQLAQRNLPSHISIIDAGTPGWGLPMWFEGQEKVIIIDAVRMGEPPGTWKRFDPETVKLFASGEVLSLHEPGLANGLALAEALGALPEEIVIYGIEPAQCEIAQGLSPAIQQVLPPLVEEIYTEIWNG
jgi:hydrogenase maturation protease